MGRYVLLRFASGAVLFAYVPKKGCQTCTVKGMLVSCLWRGEAYCEKHVQKSHNVASALASQS